MSRCFPFDFLKQEVNQDICPVPSLVIFTLSFGAELGKQASEIRSFCDVTQLKSCLVLPVTETNFFSTIHIINCPCPDVKNTNKYSWD